MAVIISSSFPCPSIAGASAAGLAAYFAVWMAPIPLVLVAKQRATRTKRPRAVAGSKRPGSAVGRAT